ncbi:MAG: anaerobic ribonucleoside-triphosphate reductase activating protein [Desulfobacterota bacterium]|nr:anaerobic ribonucleoside-triphosphate reductase activating protein [Thermodesulfobacteriota bacterium]
MKGFLDTSFIDWDGYMCAVIFLGGCNFRCPFCHNRDLVLFPGKLSDMPLSYVRGRLKRYRKWIDRVVITGGEPTIHDGLLYLLQIFKEDGFKVKLDTNGYLTEVIKNVVERGLIDSISMDIKGPIDRYEKWCGLSIEKKRIERTVEFLKSSPIDYEFRITFVPSFHEEEDIYEVARFLKGAKVLKVQGFRPKDTIDPSFMQIVPASREKLENIRKKVREILEG